MRVIWWMAILSVRFLGSPATGDPGQSVEITLIDGTTVQGIVVAETDDSIEITSPTLGALTISRANVRAIDRFESATSQRRSDPDLNSLMFVPTSETLPKGDHYYRNFEVLFNNLGLSVTDDFNLSIMAAFPVTGDVTVGSVGAKLRVMSRETHPAGVAVAASVFIFDSETVSTLNLIASVGNRYRSLNAAANIGFAGGESEVFFLVGGDYQFSQRAKFIVEVGTSESAITNETDLKGLINMGVRVFWRTGSFSLTAFRPTQFDDDGFVAFPMGQVSLHF